MPDYDLRKWIHEALSRATDTRVLSIGINAVRDTGAIFHKCFGQAEAMVVADTNTMKAAGETVLDVFRKSGISVLRPFVFDCPDFHAEYEHVQALCNALGKTRAIPVSVGSGTINDLAKLSSHQCGRPLLVSPHSGLNGRIYGLWGFDHP